VVSSTSITATTPAGNAGAVTVTVTNPGPLTGSLVNGYTYVVPTLPTAPGNLSVMDSGPVPTVVASQSYLNSMASASDTTAAFNSTGGNLIVLLASSHSGVTFTPSDSFNNTWIPIAGPTSAPASLGFDERTQLWYAPNAVVGPEHTVTMALSAAQPLVMSVIVVNGSNISSPIDAVSLIGSDNGTQTTNVVSPTITTASANDLLIGFVKVESGTSADPGPGFTLQAGGTLSNLVAETGQATTPGTYDATFTLSSSQSWESVVAAVANNPNQTTLSWTASTETGGTIAQYLVERCQGANCTNFAQIGTTTATTYNDTGLTASTSYSYRVRAEDTSGNIGPYSGVQAMTTAGQIPSIPSAPENLTAAGPVVTAVQSYVSSTSLTSHTSPAFNSTGGNLIVLAASSQAGVTFTPTDSFGNTWISAAGPTNTTTGSDLRTQIWYAQNPTVGPGQMVTFGLSAAEPLAMSIVVVENANATSPIDVVSLIGSDNGTQSTSVVSPSITTTGLNDLLIGFGDFSSGFQTGIYGSLAGRGFSQQAGASSNLLDAETGPVVTPGSYAATFVLGAAQTWQAAVVAAANNPTQVTLSWTPSAEIGGNEIVASISYYLVERCQGAGCTGFAQIATTPVTTFNDTTLAAGTNYNYRVRAQDTTGTMGPYSSIATVTTPGSAP
jgi:chitodextrinase